MNTGSGVGPESNTVAAAETMQNDKNSTQKMAQKN